MNLAKKIVELSGENLKNIKVLGNFKNTDRIENREINYRVCSIEKAKKLINFKPKVSLEKGIYNILNNFNIISSWPTDN